jgi:hypothetical protein
MKKISRLKSFFFLLRKQECKAIATFFTLITFGMSWGCFKEWKIYNTQKSQNEKKQGEQNAWLSREQEINERFRNIIDNMLRRDKIDQPKLMTLVKNAAQKLSLKYNIGMPEAQNAKFFAFNKISIDLKDVYFTDVLNFDDAVELQNSNLCIDNMELTINGKTLSAEIGISALDIKADNDAERIVAQILNSHNLNEKIIMWNDRKNLME